MRLCDHVLQCEQRKLPTHPVIPLSLVRVQAFFPRSPRKRSFRAPTNLMLGISCHVNHRRTHRGREGGHPPSSIPVTCTELFALSSDRKDLSEKGLGGGRGVYGDTSPPLMELWCHHFRVLLSAQLGEHCEKTERRHTTPDKHHSIRACTSVLVENCAPAPVPHRPVRCSVLLCSLRRSGTVDGTVHQLFPFSVSFQGQLNTGKCQPHHLSRDGTFVTKTCFCLQLN